MGWIMWCCGSAANQPVNQAVETVPSGPPDGSPIVMPSACIESNLQSDAKPTTGEQQAEAVDQTDACPVDSLEKGTTDQSRPLVLRIKLEKNGRNIKIGLDITKWKNPVGLHVAALKEAGLIPEWNEAHPECQVQVNDVIVEVNGHRSDPGTLVTTMKTVDTLDVVIERKR